MASSRKTKIALCAASSLLTAAAALAPAKASDLDPAAFPTTIEAPVVTHAADTVQSADQGKKPAQRAALIAVALGALGWLVKLLGPKKVLRAAQKTAEVTVKASAAAAKTAARAVRSPLRFLAWTAGLVLFALTGVGLYDIEWIGGLVAGAALSGLAVFSTMRMRAMFGLRPAPVKAGHTVDRN